MQVSMNDGQTDNQRNRAVIIARLQSAPHEVLPKEVIKTISTWSATSNLSAQEIRDVWSRVQGKDHTLWLIRNLLTSLQDLVEDKSKRISWEPDSALKQKR